MLDLNFIKKKKKRKQQQQPKQNKSKRKFADQPLPSCMLSHISKRTNKVKCETTKESSRSNPASFNQVVLMENETANQAVLKIDRCFTSISPWLVLKMCHERLKYWIEPKLLVLKKRHLRFIWKLSLVNFISS